MFVLSDRRLASLAEWQRAIDSRGMRLSLSTGTPIDRLSGYLPVRSREVATGFECSHCNAEEIIALYQDIKFARAWSSAIAFNWHDFGEGLAAYQAAAAYAKAVDGVVFDPQESLIMSPEQAFAAAEQFETDMPKMREAVQATLANLRKP
jgi:hypothetical protein